MLFRLADNTDASSLASRLRKRRMMKFAELLRGATGEVRILDVGGTPQFWLRNREEMPVSVSVTLLNLDFEDQPDAPWIRRVVGDARRMEMFDSEEFDMCFSNSLIEHFGSLAEQSLAAREIRRVARGYFVQTDRKSVV